MKLQTNETAQFDALKASVDKLVTMGKSVAITDDTSLAIATQNLSLINSKTKEIEALRVQIKDPYLQAGKQVDALAKLLSAPLEAVLTSGKNEIKKYEEEKLRKQQAEKARVDRIKNCILSYSENAIKEANLCKDIESLTACREKFILKFPDNDTWEEFTEDAHKMRITLNDYFKNRRIEIEAPEQADETIAEAIQETIIEQVAEVPVVEDVKTTTKFRGTWKFEIVDITQLPKSWLMPDEAKIKAFMKEHKDNLSDGLVESGVKFYVEKTVTIR